jgi:serine/threonine protein kinase
VSIMDPLIGQRLGNFEIIGRLDEGGMGVLYIAQHATLPLKAAVKVLRESYARDRALVERFLREAHACAAIDHPHVVRVFDAGCLDDGRPYIVMELLSGTTLALSLDVRSLPVQGTVRILRQVASALADVHRLGILHRDLKPENVMLIPTRDGREFVKVLDFGLSTMQGTPAPNLTVPGMVVGTPEFMSPEQAQDEPIDVRSDVYSFGCLAFALLTGGPPYRAASGMKILLAHVSAPVPSVRERRQVPDRLHHLITACMAKSPEDRPPTMDVVAAELDAIASELQLGEAVLSLPPGARMISDPLVTPTQQTTSVNTHAVRRTQNVAWIALASALGVSVIALALAFSVMSRTRKRSLASNGAASATSVDPAPSASAPPEPSEEKNPYTIEDAAAVGAGSAIWTSKCARCHGLRGDGAGTDIPSGRRPKAFSDVILPPGTLDVYYFGIIRHGVEKNGGEAMPAFADKLDVRETWQTVTYINTLRPRVKRVDVDRELRVGPPPDSPASRKLGHELFLTRCSTCHGEEGTGDGPAASYFPTPPPDLKNDAWNPKLLHKGERDLNYVFRIVTTGVGDYMGSYSSLPASERWAIAREVMTIRNNVGQVPR